MSLATGWRFFEYFTTKNTMSTVMKMKKATHRAKMKRKALSTFSAALLACSGKNMVVT
jgi:hypothetical protein